MQRERAGFLPSSAPGGRGVRVDIVISDATASHVLIDVVVANPTRRCGPYLVERALIWWLPQMQNGERRRTTKIVLTGRSFLPFASETYGVLFARSDRFSVECASLASRGCAGLGPSTSMLCTWFRQQVSIASQRAFAHAIYARFLRRGELMALLPPPLPHALLSSSELHIVASFD